MHLLRIRGTSLQILQGVFAPNYFTELVNGTHLEMHPDSAPKFSVWPEKPLQLLAASQRARALGALSALADAWQEGTFKKQ